MAHELRPFVPAEYATNGRHGQSPLNGHDAGNGHHATGVNGVNGTTANGLNGNGLNGGPAPGEASGLDDGWGAFRRTPLDRPEPPEGGSTASFPAVSPEPSDAPPPPPPGPPVDGWPTAARPAVPPPDPAPPADREPPLGPAPQAGRPDDEPRGRHSRRRAQPADDEDYRPPWW